MDYGLNTELKKLLEYVEDVTEHFKEKVEEYLTLVESVFEMVEVGIN